MSPKFAACCPLTGKTSVSFQQVPIHGTPQSVPTVLPSTYLRYSPVPTHGTPQYFPTVLPSPYSRYSPVLTHGTSQSLPTIFPSPYPRYSPVPTNGISQYLPTVLPRPYPRYSPAPTHGTPQSLPTILPTASPQQSTRCLPTFPPHSPVPRCLPSVTPHSTSPRYLTRAPTHDFPPFILRLETEEASEALCSVLVYTYQTARGHTPKDRNLVQTRNFKQMTYSAVLHRPDIRSITECVFHLNGARSFGTARVHQFRR